LRTFASARGFTLFPYFLGSEVEAAKGTALMAAENYPTTGAHMVEREEASPNVIEVSAITLDRFFPENSLWRIGYF
jgi:hypothetical protein